MPDIDLSTLTKIKPKTKDEFLSLAKQISTLLFEPHSTSPLYAVFAQEICRQVMEPCRDVDIRKTSSVLAVMATTKVAEAKAGAKGTKKGAKAGKPGLGLAKPTNVR